ncbi:DNA-binding protein [Microcoleus sp. C2C3]|uniref:DNA-binding protein n=1 Tax=unclassified Microcoleus TaxID=2642155 RepID=UPI002FCEB2C2
MTSDGNSYQFAYTAGAIVAQRQGGFKPLWSFSDWDKVYESPELFFVFSNRLLRPSPPDYPDFLRWLNLSQSENDSRLLLARSGGQRVTDRLEVFPPPEVDEDGLCHFHFFARELQHLPQKGLNLIDRLQPGDLLRAVEIDHIENDYICRILSLSTVDGCRVCNCPKYLLGSDFLRLYQEPERVQIVVEQVNLSPTPQAFRLLCHLAVQGGIGFQPFSTSLYQPILSELAASGGTIP